MFKILFFLFLKLLIIRISKAAAVEYRPDNISFTENIQGTRDSTIKYNNIDFDEILFGNDTLKSLEKQYTEESNENETLKNSTVDNLFWDLREENSSDKEVIFDKFNDNENNSAENEVLVENIFPESNETTTSLAISPTPVPVKADEKVDEYELLVSNEMNEEIVLSRNNCNLELIVYDGHDLKMQIKFESLKENAFGKCHITLNGDKHTSLAVVLSDVHLVKTLTSPAEGEKLEVVVINGGIHYVLKEYDGRNDYQSVLLTEANKVYIVLSYNGTNLTPTENITEFKLEVFNYQRNQNEVFQNVKEDYGSQRYTPPNGNYDAENIFFTTQAPIFLFNYIL